MREAGCCWVGRRLFAGHVPGLGLRRGAGSEEWREYRKPGKYLDSPRQVPLCVSGAQHTSVSVVWPESL